MTDSSKLAVSSTTANAPGNAFTESDTSEGDPPSSNAWNAMKPDTFTEPPRVVPMTQEDDRHMREDLGRDPNKLLEKQLHNLDRLEEHRKELDQHAPGTTLEDMASGTA